MTMPRGLIFTISLFLCCFKYSCSDSDENNSSFDEKNISLIGVWEAQVSSATPIIDYYTPDSTGTIMVSSNYMNGSVVITDNEFQFSPFLDRMTDYGTYYYNLSREGKKLELKYEKFRLVEPIDTIVLNINSNLFVKDHILEIKKNNEFIFLKGIEMDIKLSFLDSLKRSSSSPTEE